MSNKVVSYDACWSHDLLLVVEQDAVLYSVPEQHDELMGDQFPANLAMDYAITLHKKTGKKYFITRATLEVPCVPSIRGVE